MKSILKILAVAAGSLFLFSCTKNFQQTNTDPSKPSTTTIQPLINNVISTLFLNGQEQASADNDWEYPATQLGGITAPSGYVLANAALGLWNDYFGTLQNINSAQDIISASKDTQSMANIQAILYILKAYKTFHLINQMGDIPYFNAGKAYTGDVQYYRPKFDDQKDVYLDCLKNLAWASKNIVLDPNAKTAAGNSYVSMGNFDTFFGGNMTQWLKFANSLRLRYAMLMVEVDPTDADPIIADVVGNNLPVITDGLNNTGDVGMWPTQLNNYDMWVPFWSFYSHKFERMTTTFWNMVSDGPDSSDIFDPRAYLFVETNQAGKWAPYTIGSNASDATNPYQAARRTDPNNKDSCVFSPFNFHLICDEGYIPEVIFSAAEVHFLKAEAYLRGLGVPKNESSAESEYYAGITSSVDFWYDVAHNTNTAYDDWATVAPPSPTQAQMTAFFDNPKVIFSGTDEQKLDKIYAQEWLSFFRQPWLAWNLWRRTMSTPRDPNAIITSYATFYRIPYPTQESVNNPDNYQTEISKIGGNNSNIKMWWMK